MRLFSIQAADGEQAAVGVPGRGLAPVPSIDPALPPDVLGLLGVGLPADLAERATRLPDSALVPRDSAVHRPLVRRPRKVIGIGLNYREHAEDLSAPLPAEPTSFLKGDHTIIGAGDPIPLPPQSERVTAEAELGLVIGRECGWVSEADALDHVAGICAVLDQTAEDIFQRNLRFMTRAKNFPGFLSLGSELVSLDELGPVGDVRVTTVLNGAVVRSSTVASMIFSPAHLVSFHSAVMPLYPGDVISSGTPGAAVLAEGDVVEARIEGLAALVNPVTTS